MNQHNDPDFGPPMCHACNVSQAEYIDSTPLERTIALIKLANKYALTCEHPAYKQAEKCLSRLSAEDAAFALKETGGLKAVIGQGITI